METDKIARYLWIGRHDQHWYRQCEDVFVGLFGRDKLRLVCSLFAATSINTSLKANITLFRKALYEIENDLPVGKYLPNIQSQLSKVRNGEELSGRKIRSFSRAMSGDHNAVVVDIWLLRAFGLDRKYLRKSKGKGRGSFRNGGATDRQYTVIEEYVRSESAAMDLTPREMSAMIWSGVRIDQSGDKETHYKTLLEGKFNNLFNVI